MSSIVHITRKPVSTVLVVVGILICLTGYSRFGGLLGSGDISDDVSQYDWDAPTAVIDLPIDLLEISGLDYLIGDLIAINDELGLVYYVNRYDGSIGKTKHFALRGDYEGISITPVGIAVVRSDGILFNIRESGTEQVNTGLPNKNIEGLDYLDSDRLLLLAAKGYKSDREKVIYSYNLDLSKLDETPFLTITSSKLWERVMDQYGELSQKKQRKLRQRLAAFAPSGIAVDEISCHTYILSARGSSLLVYGDDRKLQDVVLLDEDLIPQPEGIAIDEQQTIYIASEGKSARGRLFHYKKVR